MKITPPVLDDGTTIITEQWTETQAFLLFEREDAYGVAHFTKEEKTWRETGRSSFGGGKGKELVFGASKVVKGEYEPFGDPSYLTVSAGPINNGDIMEVRTGEGKEAAIVSSGETRYWYVIGEEPVQQVNGYDKEGERLTTTVGYVAEGF
ncbi:hypothetical protein [Salimicrobium halophilum]|uniref:hypothetical protein n=1 Tax=Salimicrobium halophilum TaxID=86666 RepID=UPI000B83158E|nr:hypothetical protein [Salimicrobium halophilum]